MLVLLRGYTGLRWGEATALRVCDIDLGRRRIDVRRALRMLQEIMGHASITTTLDLYTSTLAIWTATPTVSTARPTMRIRPK